MAIDANDYPNDEPVLHASRIRGRRGWGWWTLVSIGSVILIAFAALWLMRVTLAENFVRGELDKRGVRATYTIDKVSFRTQRLTNLVIGDPARPDLTARQVEVDLALLSGADVAQIRADGVRIYGRFVDGKLSLGELDKFTTSTKQQPLGLPDLDVVLTDARGRLDTPWGAAGLKLDGRGNLQDGFKGKLAMVSTGIDALGCKLGRTTAYVDVAVADKKPSVDGPLRVSRMTCDKARVALIAPQFGVSAHFDEQLAVADAQFGVRSGPVSVRGNRLAALNGEIDLTNRPYMVATKFDLTGRGLATPWVNARGARVSGRFAAAKVSGAKDPLRFAGDIALDGAAVGAESLDRIESLDGAGKGTPFGPVIASIARAAGRAARDADVSAHVDFGRRDGNAQTLVVSDLSARSDTGARVFLDGGEGLTIDPKSGDWRLDGRVRMAGGGLPEGALSLTNRAGRISGEALFKPYAADDAVIAFAPIRFATGGGGATRLTTTLTMSGPFAGGRVEGVQLPIDATLARSGRLALQSGCTPITYRRIAIAQFVTQPGAFRLCADVGRPLFALGANGAEGGVTVVAPDIRARIGKSPMTIAATRMRYVIEDGAFTGSDVAVAIGDPAAPVRMTFASLDGAFLPGAIRGTIAGGEGRIANVPIALRSVGGDWSYIGNRLTVTGALRASDVIADSGARARFEQVVARAVTFVLEGDDVTADGVLVEPLSGRDIATLDVAHRLSSGVGHADIGVAGITFDTTLQPSQLFKSALGVVANVRGTVTGNGQIRWTGSDVTSDGTFHTAGMDLAAPFGPVQGITTEVRFTDLLGLVSAPATAMVASVNPGIEVTDGVVGYRLLPEQRIGIDGAKWPFVGGTLTLRPTVLDFAENQTRTLTFDIDALDAAIFIERFGVSNLSATGIFDGTLPITFDQTGGRVNQGLLIARSGGGTIRYVGELTNNNLGTYANIAFQALKSLRYQKLSIGLDGRLDGEMVTDIKFEGLSQGEGAARNIFTRAIGKIPFAFNIKINAPFRQLIFAARSYYQPELLIEQNLPALIKAQEDAEAKRAKSKTNGAVQPPLSEEKP